MYWGHLGHFHRAISHLKLYKMFFKKYLACTFSQIKSINMFSMFLQSGVPRHFLWRFIAVWMYNLTVSCILCISMLTSNSNGFFFTSLIIYLVHSWVSTIYKNSTWRLQVNQSSLSIIRIPHTNIYVTLPQIHMSYNIKCTHHYTSNIHLSLIQWYTYHKPVYTLLAERC